MEHSDDDFMKNSWHDVDIVDCSLNIVAYCRILYKLSQNCMFYLTVQTISSIVICDLESKKQLICQNELSNMTFGRNFEKI